MSCFRQSAPTALAAALMGALLATLPAAAQDLVLQAELTGAPGDTTAPGDQLGAGVALDGDLLVATAPGHDLDGADVGAAFVYRKAGGEWLHEATLVPSDRNGDSTRLRTVGAAGDTVVACSTDAVSGGVPTAGSCWVFERVGTTWTETARIEPPVPAVLLNFGFSVALADDIVAIGAPGDQVAGIDSGAVFVFRRIGSVWSLEQKLVASDGSARDGFGWSVDLAPSGNLAIGAPRRNLGGDQPGAAYVFGRSGGSWSELTSVVPPGALDEAAAGTAVVFADDATLVVGSPQWDGSGTDVGRVDVFHDDGGTWSHLETLTAASPPDRAWLGATLAAAPSLITAGSPGIFDGSSFAGSVESFVLNGATWQTAGAVSPGSVVAGSRFGAAVALEENGTTLVASAPSDDLDGTLAGGVFLFSSPSPGSWDEVRRIRPTSTGAFDQLGTSVALDGDLALAGVPLDDIVGIADAGSAVVYRRIGSTWHVEQQLTASDASEDDAFGLSLDLDGDRAVVAAWKARGERGQAYVFDRDPADGRWSQVSRLQAADGSRGDEFGVSVGLDGDRVAVAARGGSVAYVFERDAGQWTETATLDPQQSPGAGPWLSGAAAVSGDRIAIGYPGDPDGGSVTVMLQQPDGSWAVESVLRESAAADGSFGFALHLDDDLLVVGSPDDNGTADSTGAVWVYRRSGSSWTLEQRLLDPDGGTGDRFGFAVTHDGSTLAAGALGADGDDGRILVFTSQGGTWDLVQSIGPPGNVAGGRLGGAISLSGATLLAGAPTRASVEGAPGAGGAFVYTRPEPPTASCSWSPTRPAAGAGVQFLDASTGSPDSWEWRFGDGATSDEMNPVHVYSEPGAYLVELTVRNALGESTANQVVDVGAGGEPRAGFSWSPAFPSPGDTVSFTDRSAGGLEAWSWNFGDGAASVQPSPNHVFAAPGEFEVELTVSGPGGTSTVTRTVEVTDVPTFTPDASIAAVAQVQGVGAFFTSRVNLLNTSDQAVDVDLVYTPRQDVGGPSHRTVVTLEARTQVELSDPLAVWFGFGDGESAVGALRFAAIGSPGAVLGQSVVIARNADGTEYGQFFPAVPADGVLTAGTTAFLASTVDAARTRVNLGVMATDDATVVRVAPEDPVGTGLSGSRVFSLDAGESAQLNDLDRRFSLGGVSDYVVRATVEAGEAIVYTSVLDGTATVPGTSDPTTILPVVGGADRVTLLELGPIVGFDEFSGSASITNLGGSDVQITATFFARGTPGAAATEDLTVPAGETLGFLDVVGDLFQLSGVGTVVLEGPPGARLTATGREFSILRGDGGQIVGTAGQLIPGMTDEALLRAGARYHLLGLRQIETGGGLERSHVAAFNPGSDPATVTLELYDGATGALEGTFDLRVRGTELVQRNNIIQVITGSADGRPKRIEAVSDRPVHLKAFRVNKDGDPITIDALAAPTPR